MLKSNEEALVAITKYNEIKQDFFNFVNSKKYVIELYTESYLIRKLFKYDLNFNGSYFCFYNDYIVKDSKFFVYDDLTKALYQIIKFLKTDERFEECLEKLHHSKVIFKIYKNKGWFGFYDTPIFHITNQDIKLLLKIKDTENESYFEKLLELKNSDDKSNREIAKQILKNLI